MALKHIPMEEATNDQLRAFADQVLQIEIPARANAQAIRGKIAEVWSKDTITVDDASTGEVGPGRRTGSNVQTRPRVDASGNPVMTTDDDGKPVQEFEAKILLHVSDKPGGDEPAFVSINGRGMYIERGKESWVPEKFVAVLKDAEELHYPEYTGGDGGLGQPRVVHSYPFSHV